MRTLEEIQQSILAKKEETSSLTALDVLTDNEKQTISNLTSSSKVAIWRLWVFIQSFSIWLHEQIFEVHKKEMEEIISLNKIHTSRWYRLRALEFQFGFDYPETEITGYNNEGVEEAVIINSKIISQASVEEIAGRLKIKTAKNGLTGDLEPLESEELSSFSQYMNLIKDAGTRLEIISRPPDDLKLEIDIYFDPLILNATGVRLDGTNPYPVLENIKEFLKNLEFNGELILTKLVDSLQEVEGVEIPVIQSAQARFGTNPYSDINETYISDAGYMSLSETETIINYIPREV